MERRLYVLVTTIFFGTQSSGTKFRRQHTWVSLVLWWVRVGREEVYSLLVWKRHWTSDPFVFYISNWSTSLLFFLIHNVRFSDQNVENRLLRLKWKCLLLIWTRYRKDQHKSMTLTFYIITETNLLDFLIDSN